MIFLIILPNPYGISAPENLEHLLLFLLTMLSGALVMTSLIVLYPIITMHTLNEKGIVGIIVSSADILSGVIVPIPFFPKMLQRTSGILPFQYISDLPFRIYVGNIEVIDGVKGLGIQLIWIIILTILGYYLMKKSLKN